ncbi:MAG: tRNA uridine-5-carboxymethylaminomethyl(34) synthesis GTPase MnmE [Candidatus Izemoplasmataceae bacterium]
MITDTIAAISTALGQSAINIVRMSGDDAINIANLVFRGKDLTKAKSHTVHYGHIIEDSMILDEVLITVFKAPKTFTTQDIIEINCHGGTYVARKILSLLLSKGARLANNGEFTERAFLNGRIDLTQAESIMDIIEAQSKMSLTLANKGLDGAIYQLIIDLRDQLLSLIAHIEVNIDYPEYDDVITLSNELIKPKVESLLSRIKEILKKSEYGKIIKEGLKTAIIGRPNVGKSSLLNALLKEEKAIVTEIQGTTRDTIEGFINIGGIILNLVDTAGIRDSEDIVEKIGIDKAKKVINEAELILFVLDQSETITEDDKKLLELTKHKKRIIIINKSDLHKKLTESFQHSVEISARNNVGIQELEELIQTMFLKGEVNLNEETYLSNARQIAKLKEAKSSLQDSLYAIKEQLPIDMVEIDLKTAWSLLGDIIGANSSTNLLDELFSKFCLGK